METLDNQTQPIQADEREGQFFCGICGWIDISEYVNHGHEQEGN